MCGEYLFLFFKNVADFFLKSEVLLPNIVVFEGRFHYVHIFFYLLFVNSVHLGVYLLLYLVVHLVVFFLTVHTVAFGVVSSLLLGFVYQRKIWRLLLL